MVFWCLCVCYGDYMKSSLAIVTEPRIGLWTGVIGRID